MDTVENTSAKNSKRLEEKSQGKQLKIRKNRAEKQSWVFVKL